MTHLNLFQRVIAARLIETANVAAQAVFNPDDPVRNIYDPVKDRVLKTKDALDRYLAVEIRNSISHCSHDDEAIDACIEELDFAVKQLRAARNEIARSHGRPLDEQQIAEDFIEKQLAKSRTGGRN